MIDTAVSNRIDLNFLNAHTLTVMTCATVLNTFLEALDFAQCLAGIHPRPNIISFAGRLPHSSCRLCFLSVHFWNMSALFSALLFRFTSSLRHLCHFFVYNTPSTRLSFVFSFSLTPPFPYPLLPPNLCLLSRCNISKTSYDISGQNLSRPSILSQPNSVLDSQTLTDPIIVKCLRGK